MIEWLEHPHELGEAPAEIECAGTFELHDMTYYLFRYKREVGGKWLLGVCGGYEGGEVFRSGVCYRRGCGRIFYFQPGHETLRSFHNPYVQLILRNAAHWAARDRALDRELHSDFAPALEPKREEEE